MIFYKYLFKEIAKTQLVILVILLTVFLCQSLIRLISRAALGSIPVEIISSMALYLLPEIVLIMLPLTQFLAILLALGRICSDSEMVVLRSVGFSPVNVMGVTLVLALITALLCAVNSMIFIPKAAQARYELQQSTQNNPQFLPIESGRFVNLGERFTVYIDEVGGKAEDAQTVERIYVMDAPFDHERSSITLAERGYLQHDADNVRWLYLFDGKRYEGRGGEQGAFRRVNFTEFRAPVVRGPVAQSDDSSKDTQTTLQLLKSERVDYQVEAQWRLSAMFAVIVLSMVAVPLSMVNPRQGRFAKLMPALLIYAAYYMFLLSTRNLINHHQLPLYPGMFLVPVLFTLLVAVPLNLPRHYLHNLLKKDSPAAAQSAADLPPHKVAAAVDAASSAQAEVAAVARTAPPAAPTEAADAVSERSTDKQAQVQLPDKEP